MPAKKNKNKQLDPAGMVAALSPTTAENYLGDPKVIEWLLRNYVNNCFERCAQMKDDRLEAARIDVVYAKDVANILLGKNADYPPVEGWNRPGVIDRWLVDEFHLPAENAATPEDAVVCIIVTFLLYMYDLSAAIEKLPDEDAQMSVNVQ